MSDAYSELLAAAGDEPVEGIVFGGWGWASARDDDAADNDDVAVPSFPKDKLGKLLTLAEAEPHMHGWRFDGGFGAPECFPIYAWTKSRVLFVHEYDGSTGLSSVPRNPCSGMPEMNGE